MSTNYTINVTNESPNIQDFFFFQQPAEYIGGETVYTNSIYHSKLRGKDSGATLTFQLELETYAGVQTQSKSIIVGEASGSTHVIKEIDITPESGTSKNTTDMEIEPLGLTDPVSDDDVEKGAFRINTPTFNPNVGKYNVGLGVKNSDGGVTLSNFINAEPGKHVDVQPKLVFYVKTGAYQAGVVVNFTTSSKDAAMCDATDGVAIFNVVYNADGTWSVS
jgi:hypothetical protein